MTGRHVVLPIGAVLVLGLGVYLFVEVRAEPVPPQIAAPARPPRPTPQAAPEIAHGDEPATAPPRSSDRPVRAPRPAAAGPPSRGPDATVVTAPAPELDAGPGGDAATLDAVMAEANKAYDRGDFEEAKTIAGRLLATQPGNVRMLRIMVSASCIDGDAALAQASFVKLPPGDQEQMRVRCTRYGIALTDKP